MLRGYKRVGEGTTAFKKDKGSYTIKPGHHDADLGSDTAWRQHGQAAGRWFSQWLSSAVIAELRRNLELICSLHISVIGVDGSPEAAAEVSQFLCLRTKNWTGNI